MKYLVEVPLDDAPPVVMEIDDGANGGVVRASRPGEVVATVTMSFNAALEKLQPMAQTIIAKLRDLAESPDEIGVEFGLKMTMEAGLVVAHTSGEANFKVVLSWKRSGTA